MKISPSKIPDVLIIHLDLQPDSRGHFLETWHAEKYAQHGLDATFVQDNQSRSTKGVLRGLHYQLRNPQGKLVHVARGAVLSVAVDIRTGSPSFGQWVGIEISDSNALQVYVPPGFAYGYCVLSDTADFLYKCTRPYAPEDEYGIMWNDPDISIEWPKGPHMLSEKDANNGSLRSALKQLPRYEALK